jgi:hypothetical protein
VADAVDCPRCGLVPRTELLRLTCSMCLRRRSDHAHVTWMCPKCHHGVEVGVMPLSPRAKAAVAREEGA